MENSNNITGFQSTATTSNCPYVCQPIVCHDWETAFCGCKKCKRCQKREYGYSCGGLPNYWNSLTWFTTGPTQYQSGTATLC